MNSDGPTPALSRPTTRLASLLGDLGREAAGSESAPAAAAGDISIGEILDRTRHAGFGFVAALLALASIPLVGLTVPFGIAVAALGVQMIAGLSRPWLPGFIRRRRITAVMLDSLSQRTAHWTAKVARIIRPRCIWLTAGPFWTLCGLGLVIQGLSLTLPIPGADWLFVVPIVLYGVALLEGDGVLVLACHLLTLAQVIAGVLLWELIARGFADVYRWCASVLS